MASLLVLKLCRARLVLASSHLRQSCLAAIRAFLPKSHRASTHSTARSICAPKLTRVHRSAACEGEQQLHLEPTSWRIVSCTLGQALNMRRLRQCCTLCTDAYLHTSQTAPVQLYGLSTSATALNSANLAKRPRDGEAFIDEYAPTSSSFISQVQMYAPWGTTAAGTV